jgi:streptomycin 6-kinase
VIVVPEAFARSTAADAGEQGRAWTAALPELVGQLSRRWSCVADGPVMYGRVGLVVPVRRRDRPAVLKVSFPRSWNGHEAAALAAWDGGGAVRLYEYAAEHHAMLLERAHSRTLAEVTDPERAVAIQGRLVRRLAVPAPAGFPLLSDLAAGWADRIRGEWAAQGEPLPARVVAAALATLGELGPDQPATLVHGDLHDANVLASEREPWLAIDPKICVGDPAYDAFTVIFSPRFAPLLASPDPKSSLLRLIDIYCDAAEVDVIRARRWTQAGAVLESLEGRRDGEPEQVVRASDRLAVSLA